jgi:hypothetical protein
MTISNLNLLQIVLEESKILLKEKRFQEIILKPLILIVVPPGLEPGTT